MSYKILLNKKYSLKHPFFKKSQKDNLLTIFNFYDGFEGECLNYFETNDSEVLLKKSQQLQEQINNLNKLEHSLLITLDEKKDPQNTKLLLEDYNLIGYDYGILLDEDELYSSILQEILLGRIEKLKFLKNELNKRYLFPSNETAAKYARKHHDLLLEGFDVEVEDDMKIYEIWKYKIS